MRRLSLERKLLSDGASEAVQDLILRGDLPPGSRVTEDQLARLLGVSRVPIREALRDLEHRRLICSEANGGRYVARISDADVRELQEVRAALERYAVRRVALAWQPEHFAELSSVLQEMEAVLNVGGSTLRLVNLDHTFHSAIWRLTGNGHFIRIMDEMLGPVFLFIFVYGLTCRDRMAWTEVLSFHQRILEALASGDPDTAEAAMLEHLSAALGRMLGDGTVAGASAASHEPDAAH